MELSSIELPAELPFYQLAPMPPAQPFLDKLTPQQKETGLDNDQASLEFHPDFAKISAGPALRIEGARALLQRTVDTMKLAFAAQPEFFVDEAQVLHFARVRRSASDGIEDVYEPADQPMLLYVTLRRTQDKIPIVGPGSRFTVAVQDDGPLQGAVFSWKRVGQEMAKIKSPARPLLAQEITKQLLKTRPTAPEIVVNQVQPAYYDSDRAFLQPVVRYVAEVKPSSASVGRTDFVVGYVPFAQESEKELLDDFGREELLPAPTNLQELQSFRTPPVDHRLPNQIAVGRYVGFDEQDGEKETRSGFVRDSEAFWRELSRAPRFKDEQNFYAGRWLFTTRKDWFVNLVDVALVDAHGFPSGFTPLFDFGELTRMNSDVPFAGYGSGGDGQLKHMIFHSCRTVATVADPGATKPLRWATPWWDLFNGLSSVTGYRSSMFIEDGAGAALAKNLRKFQPVVPAWFGAVTSLNAYAKDNDWMRSECTDNEPMGRASAIAVCDGGSMATVATGSAPRPNCLEAWWLGDERVSLVESPAPPIEATPVKEGRCPDRGDFKPPYPGTHP